VDARPEGWEVFVLRRSPDEFRAHAELFRTQLITDEVSHTAPETTHYFALQEGAKLFDYDASKLVQGGEL
jgi:hypothetical protein